MITYKGKELPFKIGHMALKRWQKETGKKLSELGSVADDLESLEILFWNGVVAGHLLERKDLEITREEFELIMEDQMASMMDEFNDSQSPDKAVKEEAEKK